MKMDCANQFRQTVVSSYTGVGVLLLAGMFSLAQAFGAEPPGVVIAHEPATAQVYLGSPSLAILPDGEFIASHDFFGPGSTSDTTRIYTSRDRGLTWERRAEIHGAFWSSLFVHRRALYLLGTSRQDGFVVIRRSTDSGRTWTEPHDARSGLLLADAKYHCAPTPVIEHAGRVWRGFEDVMGPGGWGSAFRSFMLSAPAEADLLVATNWTASNRLGRDATWLDGRFGGWLEGNAVVTPAGQIANVLRVDYRDPRERAAVVNISADGANASFDPARGFIEFPGGCKKFTIRRDPLDGSYWSLSNFIPEAQRGGNVERTRNTLALVHSRDLRAWEVRAVLLQHPDRERHAFQYADWQFDGHDLVAAVRTAFDDDAGGAHNSHDANFITFHRWPEFRQLTMKTSVAAATPSNAPPRAARSVHLGYRAPEGDLIYNELIVDESVNGSYFMVCGWNTGYFGIQQLGSPTNKVAIFSVWDPGKSDDPRAVQPEERVEVLFEGEGTRIRRFGGEGTGGQCMTPFAWHVGETNRFALAAEVQNDKTAYTAWLFTPATNGWRRLATFRTRTGGHWLSGYYSFVEDFRRDGRSANEARRARFGHGWVHTRTNGWQSLERARFTASSATWEAKETIDAGTDRSWFYLATGGGTKRSRDLGTTIDLPTASTTRPSLPFFDARLEKTSDAPSTTKTSTAPKKVESVRAVLKIELGEIEFELEAVRAPRTTANFLRYLKAGLYDGGVFHRTVTRSNQPANPVKIEVIQASADPARTNKFFPPIALERTRDTGLRHRDGTLSMARDGPDSAQDEFFICIGDQPELDFGGKRNPDGQGFAAFGKVVRGMEVVRQIQQSKAEEQRLTPSINILKGIEKP